MTSQEIRDKFLKFFKEKGHKVMPSFSLIPEDKTVLFTTAGMQQFKKYYLNPKEAPAFRITTVQKCLRTSDIEEVGDKTHLTFFEMLGNFSFGYPAIENSYFKEEAIKWAFEFLTGEEGLKIDKKRIFATYFEGDKEKGVLEDKESLEILKKIKGLSEIKPQGFEDNFWSLGTEKSPGGPTVEFYVDGVEIWNLVFNEYIFENGKYNPAEFKGVDTGMGLERLTAMMQGKDNVFETDLLKPIYYSIEKKLKQAPEILRKITDHIKASCFLIDQGIIPASKHKKGEISRGSVLRTLLRKSIIYASLTPKENWYIQAIKETIEIYKDVYPELERNEKAIIKVIQTEEENFGNAIEESPAGFNEKLDLDGLRELHNIWIKNSSKASRVIPGEEVKVINPKEAYRNIGEKLFFFYQTHGFPLERSLQEVEKYFESEIFFKDEIKKGFKEAELKHQEISRKGAEKKFKGGLADESYETTKLHTAAHLLVQALREVLGDHVFQKGSNITQERLRFDFSHPEKLTEDEIKKVEELVNQEIKENLPVSCEEMAPEEAKKQGAMGVFDERYGDKVKVYSVGSFSKEICGGPHVKNTSELGEFKIKKQESASAGIRRIKAILL